MSMDFETVSKVAELGTTVAVVALFIWYLWQRNGKQDRAMQRLGISFALTLLDEGGGGAQDTYGTLIE